jgi:signal transduction histidine kinase
MQKIYELLSAVKKQSDVIHVYVYDVKGRIIHDGTKGLISYDKTVSDESSRQALARRQLTVRTDGDALYVAAPIKLQEELLGGVQIAYSLKQIRADIAAMKNDLEAQYQKSIERNALIMVALAAAFSVVGLFLAITLARSWSHPISVLSALSERIGRGEYDVDIPIRRSDEIGQLAGAFEDMTKNLKDLRQKETAQADELSTAYKQLKDAHDQLVNANKGKDEFLSVMSHELRTPLNVIMGYTGMIKEGILGNINTEQERALEKVIGRSGDLLIMINQILQATSIEAGKVHLEKRDLQLKSFLENLKSNYEVPLNKGIAVNWDYPMDTVTIHSDSAKLKHILQNLINNAIKFTAQGSVNITAKYLPETDTVEFQVADTGIGISEEMLPTIFEIFQQVDSSETRTYGGVGIGLYIVKKYTDLLGGEIVATSAPGKGTTFTLTIPTDAMQKPSGA